jgi:serine/threonine protein kinase
VVKTSQGRSRKPWKPRTRDLLGVGRQHCRESPCAIVGRNSRGLPACSKASRFQREAELLAFLNHPNIAPGTKIGSYEIHSPLGAAGMGEVYRARDPSCVGQLESILHQRFGLGNWMMCLVASKTEISAPQLQSPLNNPRFRSCGHDVQRTKAKDRSVILRFAFVGFGPTIHQAAELR